MVGWWDRFEPARSRAQAWMIKPLRPTVANQYRNRHGSIR